MENGIHFSTYINIHLKLAEMVLFSLIVFLTLKLVRDGAAVHPAGRTQAQQASHPSLLYMAT